MAEKDNIEITPKALGIIMAVFVAFSSGVPLVSNKLTSQSRHDPCTGTQCRAFQRQIDSLTEQIETNAEAVHDLEQWKGVHSEWGRDRSIEQAEKDGRQDAQIMELQRFLQRAYEGL